MKKMKKRAILILAMMVLLLTFTVGGTIAFIVTSDGPVENTFTAGKVTCAVLEDSFENGVSTTKNNVRIKNTGNTEAWIRAMVVANWYIGNDIVAPATVDIATPSGWSKSGSYYYCNSIISAGSETPTLISEYKAGTAPVEDAHLEMTIVCQAVQSNLGNDAVTAFTSAAQQPAN